LSTSYDRDILGIMEPIPMILHCPRCGMQHIDRPDATVNWDKFPHRSHECQNKSCGYVWRPADVPTVGVQYITTMGSKDNHDHRRK
jgi:rubredoxin